MKRAPLIALGLLLAGCSPAPDAQLQKVDALQEHVSKLEDRLEQLEQRVARPQDVAEVDARLKEEIQVLRKEQDQNAIVYRSVTDDVRSHLRSVERRIGALESKAESPTPAPAAETPAPAAEKGFSTFTPPPAPPPPVPEDTFPMRVFDIAGRQIITATNKSTQYVETEDTYRDEYGMKIKRVKPVEVDVHEYAFEAAFSLENRTASTQQVSAVAGEDVQTFALNPSEVRTNLAVRSKPGARLRVGVGTVTRSFPVTY